MLCIQITYQYRKQYLNLLFPISKKNHGTDPLPAIGTLENRAHSPDLSPSICRFNADQSLKP